MSELPQPIDVKDWPRPRGYANATVATGRVVTLAGQIGWDPETGKFSSDDFVVQVGQALANVVTVLRAAGGTPQHLMRLTWFITDKAAYVSRLKEIGTTYRATIGAHYPAMSVVVVSALVEDRAQVEIEAIAVLP